MPRGIPCDTVPRGIPCDTVLRGMPCHVGFVCRCCCAVVAHLWGCGCACGKAGNDRITATFELMQATKRGVFVSISDVRDMWRRLQLPSQQPLSFAEFKSMLNVSHPPSRTPARSNARACKNRTAACNKNGGWAVCSDALAFAIVRLHYSQPVRRSCSL